MRIYIPRVYIKDKRIWPFSKNGQVTTKSAYRAIIKNRSGTNPTICSINWKAYWKIFLPQRILLLGWKCLRKAISVRSLLYKRIISSIDMTYPIYGIKNDSVEHALFHYGFARAVWFSPPLGLRTSTILENSTSDWWKDCDDIPWP